jgi:hypothetical protein
MHLEIYSAAERQEEGSQTWNVWGVTRRERKRVEDAPESFSARLQRAHEFLSSVFQTFHVWLPS